MTLEITEWKRRERELLHLVGRLQQLPEYVTRDLLDPLEIAQGYVDLAREGDDDAFDTIDDALDRIETELEDFHTLATATRETESLERPLAFATEVRDVWQYLSVPGATLECDVPADATLVADRTQLRPLLQNLLRNAVDHAGPRVTVRVGLLDDGFYVADDGPGLGPAAETDLFREGITTASDGSGLGLAIVREAAHLHGWDVAAAESEAGGARFEVRGCLVGRPIDASPTGEPVQLSESTDVGDPAVPGGVAERGDAIVLSGAGTNVWGYVNEFQFYHAPVEGDVRLRARLADLEVVGEHTKAGVMVRSDLDADAAYGFVGRYADRFPEVLWREQPGSRGTSDQIGGIDPDARWLRIDSVGDEICCAVSADGEEWEVVDRRRVALGESSHVGLAVCSVVPDEAVDARFEDVEVVRLER